MLTLDCMSLLSLAIVLVVVGVLLWLVTTYIPLDPSIRRILVAVVILFVVVWLLQELGLIPYLKAVRIS